MSGRETSKVQWRGQRAWLPFSLIFSPFFLIKKERRRVITMSSDLTLRRSPLRNQMSEIKLTIVGLIFAYACVWDAIIGNLDL